MPSSAKAALRSTPVSCSPRGKLEMSCAFCPSAHARSCKAHGDCAAGVPSKFTALQPVLPAFAAKSAVATSPPHARSASPGAVPRWASASSTLWSTAAWASVSPERRFRASAVSASRRSAGRFLARLGSCFASRSAGTSTFSKSAKRSSAVSSPGTASMMSSSGRRSSAASPSNVRPPATFGARS